MRPQLPSRFGTSCSSTHCRFAPPAERPRVTQHFGAGLAPAPKQVTRERGLLSVAVFVLVGIGFREARGGDGRLGSFDTFPKNLVVKLLRDAVFSREVEAPGFRCPVLRVVSGLENGSLGEHDLVRVESQSSS